MIICVINVINVITAAATAFVEQFARDYGAVGCICHFQPHFSNMIGAWLLNCFEDSSPDPFFVWPGRKKSGIQLHEFGKLIFFEEKGS